MLALKGYSKDWPRWTGIEGVAIGRPTRPVGMTCCSMTATSRVPRCGG